MDDNEQRLLPFQEILFILAKESHAFNLAPSWWQGEEFLFMENIFFTFFPKEEDISFKSGCEFPDRFLIAQNS